MNIPIGHICALASSVLVGGVGLTIVGCAIDDSDDWQWWLCGMVLAIVGVAGVIYTFPACRIVLTFRS